MVEVKDFIFDTFLRLTSKTVPYGFEDIFMTDFADLFPSDISRDVHGNYFYKIGESRTIFASHLDTVSRDYVDVKHVIDGDFIKTDGKTTLGADDKAGVTVMLWMIKNQVPGLYYFFMGEEVGCIGSGLASKTKFSLDYDRILSFDRRGTGSIITHQSCGRSCSDSFADALCEELNFLGMEYIKDSGGVYTDSAEFADDIKECTNISVGYYKEHTNTESQDIAHLTKLAEACISVNWETLPTERDPMVYEAKPYSHYYPNYNYKDDYKDDKFDYQPSEFKKLNKYGVDDNWYDDIDRDTDWDAFASKSIKHKTRRSNNKKSKTYFDEGFGDLRIIDTKDPFDEIRYNQETGGDKYSWIMDKYLNNTLTIGELDVIAEQYLDLLVEHDRNLYDFLLSKVY